jgi:hypothetical protein
MGISGVDRVILALATGRLAPITIVFATIYFGDLLAICKLINRMAVMGEVANQVHQEFWHPPLQTVASDAATHEYVEACPRCGTEFIVGSRYCHSCGATRPELNATSHSIEIPGFAELRALGERFGLTTASLIAFLLGIVCVVGALTVGVVFSARTLLDWQAIQIWRIEWLLGAISAMVAGCLLKKSL